MFFAEYGQLGSTLQETHLDEAPSGYKRTHLVTFDTVIYI